MNHYLLRTACILISLAALTACYADANLQDNERRITAINDFLDHYERPFTLLYIGPFDDSVAHIAQTYACVCVVCPCTHSESYTTSVVNEKLKQYSNVVILGNALDNPTIKRLGECEHFDVVLSLNPLESFKKLDVRLITRLRQLGDHLIIEIPNKHLSSLPSGCSSKVRIAQYLNTQTSLCLLEGPRQHLLRKTWIMRPMKEASHKIESSFSHKYLIKRMAKEPPYSYRTTRWYAGINLVTFKMCRGIYPTNLMLKKSMQKLQAIHHPDWMVNNMILRGSSGFVFIDMLDKDLTHYRPYDAEFQPLFDEFLNLFEPEAIQEFFWLTFVPTYIPSIPFEKCAAAFNALKANPHEYICMQK
jgi:hypothetical protein